MAATPAVDALPLGGQATGRPAGLGRRSWLLRVDCNPDGGMEIDHGFFVDLADRPDGPARAHEVRLQGGDCTTEIFQ